MCYKLPVKWPPMARVKSIIHVVSANVDDDTVAGAEVTIECKLLASNDDE